MKLSRKSPTSRTLTILVTTGLVTGYALAITSELRRGQKQAAVGNSILLPASLVWLWFIQ